MIRIIVPDIISGKDNADNYFNFFWKFIWQKVNNYVLYITNIRIEYRRQNSDNRLKTADRRPQTADFGIDDT